MTTRRHTDIYHCMTCNDDDTTHECLECGTRGELRLDSVTGQFFLLRNDGRVTCDSCFRESRPCHNVVKLDNVNAFRTSGGGRLDVSSMKFDAEPCCSCNQVRRVCVKCSSYRTDQE